MRTITSDGIFVGSNLLSAWLSLLSLKKEKSLGWQNLFDLMLAVIPVLEERKQRDHYRATAALVALSDAFHSTVTYYEAEKPNSFNFREAQLRLAEKWDRAASLTQFCNSNIASRFSLKSRFWYEGEAWTEKEIQDANIGLHRIRKDARLELLKKQKRG